VAQAGAIVTRSIRQEVTLDRVLLGLLALALVFALGVLCLGLFQPLFDYFFPRETQTAITTYWLMRGGPIFAYETPILGYPWSIPLEFPVYQIVVAILSSAGKPDSAGSWRPLSLCGTALGVAVPKLRVKAERIGFC
jgi:hypothetical protein